ncbi:ATP-dependent DNA helicase HFM1/MER3 [Cryptococcus bacillisporus CA1873]|uniref:DNA 3'-5' helicase n=1 Tax=Cryptococcus bacillisporus CA1873 TaxID=1296111 RepID=A0ABR5B7H4_CRYGA|nr:ATP-dependent DNA helicase HFM1/MER3 [Cryptococcus bacillisporus CA1873]|eukprot:KIR59314.1 ATP-dependent DNA helicase HFM1/MER3 [Cryptococcus gattii CA1873]
MDFEEDQPLWGGSRQEEEDYFKISGLAEEYEFPHHPDDSPTRRYNIGLSSRSFNPEQNLILFGASQFNPSRHTPSPLISGSHSLLTGVTLDRNTRRLIPENSLDRSHSIILKRQQSENYGDEIWEDEEFVEAANERYNHEIDNAKEYDPVITAEMVRGREELRNNAIFNKNGKPLVPLSRLPMDQGKLFKFPCFNKVQSEVFDDVYESDENLVVSAPTGSGKTTIFELAFLHNLSFRTPNDSLKPLAVYIAPTKALCNEKAKDWQERLGQALPDVICTEITGDYGNTSTIYNSIRGADLIVTTPEKFDSMTRRSRNLGNMSQRLQLIMIDEVHILRESRGATLEVVISRLKGLNRDIRFIALSATVPNIDDIARWLGPTRNEYGQLSRGVLVGREVINAKEKRALTIDDIPMAKVYKFGEEYRPVPLQRVTYGIESAGNDWALANRLDKELYPILLRHTAGQPVLVFCPTRKSCQATVESIFQSYEEARAKGLKLPWKQPPGVRLELRDKKLAELSTCGIAVHHAGLDYADRRAIEDGFREGKLHMIASTSTLAVGVNLPAHTVVIKGVMAWQGASSGFQEYSDIDIQQMMGRAGRPQYDTSGVVVVMCERSKVRKYQSMLNSQTILESCLHENLTEYINSEIGQGTIRCVSSAQEWLKNSFFHIRIQQNPKYYALSDAKDKPVEGAWEEWLGHYVEKALINLEKDGFIERSDDDTLIPTETGKIMSSSMISYGTMCSIKAMSPGSTVQDLLEILAGSTEFQDLRIRQGESSFLNKLRTNEEIRFPLAEAVKSYADKVFLLLQVTFGNIILEDIAKKTELTSPIQTLMAIYNHAPRIAKAIVQFTLNCEYGVAARSALELHRVVVGKAWEDLPTVFRQIPSIGPKSIRVLGQNGVTNFGQLLDVESEKIQLWLNRGHVFARAIHEQARRMPRFHVTMEEENMDYDGTYNVLNLRVNIAPKTKVIATESKGKRGGFITQYNLSTLFLSQTGRFIGYRRLELKKLIKNKDNSFIIAVTLNKRCDSVTAIVGVDEVAGCSTVISFNTDLDESVYPEDLEDDEDIEPPPSQRTLVEPTSGPEEELLSNGNVRCHHSCKDKLACQHICCKSGVPPRKRNRASTRASGKSNVRTAEDRISVCRMRQGPRMSRSPSLASNIQAAIDKVQIISEVPPDTIAVERPRPRSDTPVVPVRAVRDIANEKIKEPLFLPGSDGEYNVMYEDDPSQKSVSLSKALTGSTSRYFDQLKTSRKTKNALSCETPTTPDALVPSLPSILDLLPEHATIKHDSDANSHSFRPTHGIFSDDGYETVRESPEIKHSRTFPLRKPSVDRYTEEIMQDDLEGHMEANKLHGVTTKKQAPENWEFDIGEMFANISGSLSSPKELEGAPKSVPNTKLSPSFKRPARLIIGGFGRPSIKRQRLHEDQYSTSYSPAQPSTQSENPDILCADANLPLAQGPSASVPQNEMDEFENWYMGEGG